MPKAPALIYIIDDEPTVCVAYARLIRSAGMLPFTFASVDEFIRAKVQDENACVVSDVWMPGTSGLELPKLLEQNGRRLPIIYVTGNGDSNARETAQRVGAAAYFRKPVDDQALLDAIDYAVARARSGS